MRVLVAPEVCSRLQLTSSQKGEELGDLLQGQDEEEKEDTWLKQQVDISSAETINISEV